MDQQNQPHNQQQQQQLKRRTIVNKSNKLATRKRSNSSSSSNSSGSPSTNLFSTASSSDSGSSSMTYLKSNTATKKKRTANDSPIDVGNTSSPQMRSITSTLFTSPGAIPPRLIAQRSVPAFLNKLYNMVEDLTTNDLIRWSKDGTSFIVEKHEEFAKNVLPRFYKHNTFASFVRQLNMYDFHKVPHLQQGVLIAESEHEIWEFSNPHFQRGRPDLLVLVTRKRNRDRETVDTENISLSTLVDDLATVKKFQSTIGNDIRDLHRDNEILWQETLTAREKYQRHQEAIEKILQFLTAIFANDHLAISMNNADALPKGLIEEAASLAGMSTKPDESTTNRLKSEFLASSSTTPASSLTNILSSVMRLYSNNAPPPTPPDISTQNMYKNDRHTSTLSSSDSLQYPQSPREASNDGNANKPSLIDFSKTLNTATRSAQTITQDIDMLQVNIESLASDLGIDPSQFNEDLETDRCFQDNYSNMINSANSADRAKLYAIADSNADLDKKNYSGYDHKKEQVIDATTGFNFNLQHPPLDHFQRNINKSSSFPMQGYPSNDSNNTRHNTNKSMQQQQQHDLDTTEGSYNHLMAMNYQNSYGTNYPNNENTPTPDYRKQSYDNYKNNQSSITNNGYYNSAASANPDNILPSGTTSSEFNNMVNGYADMMRPSYFNAATNGNENCNDT